jgi:hypothetical protein
MEELENRLCLEHACEVTLVRPGFGTQSESIRGLLSAFTAKYPITFQVASVAYNVIFTANDVASIVEKEEVTGQFVITLKGVNDYNNSIGGACPCGEDH